MTDWDWFVKIISLSPSKTWPSAGRKLSNRHSKDELLTRKRTPTSNRFVFHCLSNSYKHYVKRGVCKFLLPIERRQKNDRLKLCVDERLNIILAEVDDNLQNYRKNQKLHYPMWMDEFLFHPLIVTFPYGMEFQPHGKQDEPHRACHKKRIQISQLKIVPDIW